MAEKSSLKVSPLAHVIVRLRTAEVVPEPYPHYYLEKVFPEDYYQALLRHLPASAVYQNLFEVTDYKLDHFRHRDQRDLNEGWTEALPGGGRARVLRRQPARAFRRGRVMAGGLGGISTHPAPGRIFSRPALGLVHEARGPADIPGPGRKRRALGDVAVPPEVARLRLSRQHPLPVRGLRQGEDRALQAQFAAGLPALGRVVPRRRAALGAGRRRHARP